jgi:hypothetical protein
MRHNVKAMGTLDLRFEVFCKDRQRHGVRHQRVVQECLFKDDDIIAYSCQNPILLHLPCSHVIVACVVSRQQHGRFVSEYFKKEAIASAWAQEVFGVAMFEPFTQNNEEVLYVPDPATKRGCRGHQLTLRICNLMDESEAARI